MEQPHKESLKDSYGPQLVRHMVIAVLVMIIVGGLVYEAANRYVLNEAEANVQNLMLSHRGIHLYIQRTMHPAFYRARDEGRIPLDFYSPEILSSSYIVRVQHQFYNEARTEAGLPVVYYKLAANNPRNPVNKADELEDRLIRMFNEKRAVKKHRDIIKIDGREYLYYAMPFLENQDRCMKCHGLRETAPTGLQARYQGEGGFNEKVGTIRAIESIRAPLDRARWTAAMISIPLISGVLVLGGLFVFNSNLRGLVRRRTKELEQEVAERRKAEDDVRQLNENLERLVKQRTIQLESANRELDAFAYSVSHDLRAPLRGIDGFSQALEEDCAAVLDEKGREHLGRIRAGCSRMGRLIEDLLKMSRFTRGEMKVQAVNLSTMALEVVDELRRGSNRTVEWSLKDGMTAQGDATLLRAVLDNLIGNAWKFTSRTPEARIEFTCFEKDGETVYAVRDNGAGFDMAHAERLFSAFQRLHKAEEFEGTGIGLATVQRIVHRHGGRIWAEAKPGRGAAFCFTLGGNG